jgi:hypothetical protein
VPCIRRGPGGRPVSTTWWAPPPPASRIDEHDARLTPASRDVQGILVHRDAEARARGAGVAIGLSAPLVLPGGARDALLQGAIGAVRPPFQLAYLVQPEHTAVFDGWFSEFREALDYGALAVALCARRPRHQRFRSSSLPTASRPRAANRSYQPPLGPVRAGKANAASRSRSAAGNAAAQYRASRAAFGELASDGCETGRPGWSRDCP